MASVFTLAVTVSRFVPAVGFLMLIVPVALGDKHPTSRELQVAALADSVLTKARRGH